MADITLAQFPPGFVNAPRSGHEPIKSIAIFATNWHPHGAIAGQLLGRQAASNVQQQKWHPWPSMRIPTKVYLLETKVIWPLLGVDKSRDCQEIKPYKLECT